MSKIQKLIEKFYERPLRNDLTFNEIQKISEHYGCKVISGGNHMKVAHIPSGTIIPIPRLYLSHDMGTVLKKLTSNNYAICLIQ